MIISLFPEALPLSETTRQALSTYNVPSDGTISRASHAPEVSAANLAMCVDDFTTLAFGNHLQPSRSSSLTHTGTGGEYSRSPATCSTPAFSSHHSEPQIEHSGGGETIGHDHNAAQANATLEVLDSCSLVRERLGRAKSLRDVIKQVRSGEVARYRAQFGPSEDANGKKKKAHEDWSHINVTITRRERIYEQLMTEFNGNEASFYTFFTAPTAISSSRKRKRTTNEDQLRALRPIAEAIPHMQDDIAAEQRALQYQDPQTRQFSLSRWQEQWGNQNKWEVWRALGKETYSRG